MVKYLWEINGFIIYSNWWQIGDFSTNKVIIKINLYKVTFIIFI